MIRKTLGPSAMRVRDLRQILQGIERVFKVSGAKSQHAKISKVAAALEQHDHRDLGTYLKAVETELDSSAGYTRRLLEAGLREAAFKMVFGALEGDRQIKKADLVRIAEGYTGSADRKAAAKKLLKHIRTHFYTKLYERDANELAKRATPV